MNNTLNETPEESPLVNATPASQVPEIENSGITTNDITSKELQVAPREDATTFETEESAEIPLKPLEMFLEVIGAKLIHAKWAGQPHEVFKNLPNSSKGDAGEEFIKRYANALGFEAVKIKRTGDWDIKINNKTFEVKLASEDTSGCFQFNHIRYDSKYDYILCLGITPNTLVFDVWGKGDLVTGKAGNLVSMGKNQNSSFKLTKKVNTLRDIHELKSVLDNFLN